MANLSISRAWEEGAAFAAREFRLLFPIAFLFIALPPVLTGLLVPARTSAELEQMVAGSQGEGIWLYILLGLSVTIVEIVLSTLGGLAITCLALRPGTSVGESFSLAGRRLLPTLGAILIISIAAGAVLLFFSLFFGASLLGILFQSGAPGSNAGATAAGLIGGALLFMLLIMVIGVSLGAKLLPMTAVSVAEEKGPVGIISRSWQLTTGHFWKLVGTLLLIGLVYMIAAGTILLILGFFVLALIGNPEVSQTAAFVVSLLTAVLTAVVSPFLLSFTARIYAQLSGRVGEVGEVFR
jgi:hypothetical protein